MSHESFFGFFWKTTWRIKLRLFAVGLVAGAVFLCSAWVIAQLLGVQKVKPKPVLALVPALATHSQRAPASLPDYTFTYELRDVSLPLVGRNKRKVGYAQFTLVFDLRDEKSRRWMEVNRPQVMDVLLEVGHRFHFEDFQETKGYDKFKKQLKTAYREAFQAYYPREIVIKDWILN